MRTSLLGNALALALAVTALGCNERPHPWDQGDAEAPPPSPPVAHTVPFGLSSGAAPEGSASGQALSGDDDETRPPTPPVRVGGPWVRCYGNFHPGGGPLKDVTRLALLCGPENGMRRLSKKTFEGSVSEGGPVATDSFDARRGECYRVFAVAEPTVADLDVTIRSSRGAAVAADHGEDSWPIVQPDRPFCPLADDRFAVEVSAHRGRGRFAAEVWVLRSPKAPGESAPGGGGGPPLIDRIPSGE